MSQHMVFSYDQMLTAAREGYGLEAQRLARIAAGKDFAAILARFQDYPAFLRGKEARQLAKKAAKQWSKSRRGNRLTLSATTPGILEELLAHAHVAACCYLFAGSSFKREQLVPQYLEMLAQNLVQSTIGGDPRNIRTLMHTLHNVDAIRNVHLLKLAGLLQRKNESCFQLSLGAGHGSRDLAAIHQVPTISDGGVLGLVGGAAAAPNLMFNSTCPKPNDVILVDNDPDYEAYYQELTREEKGGVSAIREDTYRALEVCPDWMRERSLPLRNLVVAFRIDHRMLPDVDRFFALLSPLVEEGADFVMSMGAGHDLEEFQGRQDKLDEIVDGLTARGMAPVRMYLHQGKTMEEQRARPAYGAISFATYEVVHCKLDKQRLSA